MPRQVLLAQRGWSLLTVAAAGMGSSVPAMCGTIPMAGTQITDTAMLLCPTRGAWLDNTEPSPFSGTLACTSNGNKPRRSCYRWLEKLYNVKKHLNVRQIGEEGTWHRRRCNLEGEAMPCIFHRPALSRDSSDIINITDGKE